jgi:hypothetical protein
MRFWPWAIRSGLATAALGSAWPALAQNDPLLAGAAYAASDLSPITGVTALQFIPGKGLQRTSLDKGPPAAAPTALAALSPAGTQAPSTETTPVPTAHALGRGPAQSTGSIIDRARAALQPTAALKVPHWYMFISAGDRAIGYSFVHSSISGWTTAGVSVERSLLQSKAQFGLAWQSGDNIALVSVMRSKEQLLVSDLPGLTDDRVALTLMHEVK